MRSFIQMKPETLPFLNRLLESLELCVFDVQRLRTGAGILSAYLMPPTAAGFDSNSQ